MDRARVWVVSLLSRSRKSLAVLLATGCLAAPALAQEYNFMHFAGSIGGPGAFDAIGASARFNRPAGIAIGAGGTLYVSDYFSGTIRSIEPGGLVRTVAGLAGGSWEVDPNRGGARFYSPQQLAIDGAGNLYVAEGQMPRIRKITPTGVVTTLAGSGGTGSADGTGIAAQFSGPRGVAWDPTTGNLFVADFYNHTIRKVTMAGVVTTFAGTAGSSGSNDASGAAARFNNPSAVAVDPSGNVWVTDQGNHTIRKITPQGAVSTVAGSPGTSGFVDAAGTDARFNNPAGIAFALGVAWVADTYNNRIRKVTTAGVVTTLAGGGYGGWADGTGVNARFGEPIGVAVDSAGYVYVTDSATHVIRRVSSTGVVTTIAGAAAQSGSTDASGTGARFLSPRGVAANAAGYLYVADKDNRTVRQITPGGAVTTFAGVAGVVGSADGTGSAAGFWAPHGVAVDASGNLYVTDYDARTIRKITPAAAVTTLAGTAGSYGSTDATGADAQFFRPAGIATDSSGNVYVADRGNHTIRKITPARVVTTFAGMAGSPGSVDATGTAAKFNYPTGLASDASGNLYVADAHNHTIRKITPARVVTTIAGSPGESGIDDGTGSAARFMYPEAIASDAAGTLYVADFETARLRKITPERVVTTIAGGFQRGTEVGTGSDARFVRVGGLALSGDAIFWSDQVTHAIKQGLPAYGTVATIDAASGPVFVPRQLNASPDAGTFREWSIVRRPALSSATISSPQAASPSFTPDIPDTWVFRLVATDDFTLSITTVALTAQCWAIAVGPSSLPDGLKGTAYSQSVSAGGGMGSYAFSVAGGALPPGMTLSSGGLLAGTPTSAGGFDFTARATDEWGCFGERSYTLTVAALTAPNGLVATGTAGSVSLTWNAVTGAAGYAIYRRSAGSALVPHATSTSPSYTDVYVSPNQAYLYVVRAHNASYEESADSNADLATTVAFIDPTLVAGSTPIKAVHVTQLRTAVNAVRSVAGLGATSFTDAALAGVAVKSVHLTQLRTALNEGRATLGLPSATYTDPSPTGVAVKAVHINQLRSGVW